MKPKINKIFEIGVMKTGTTSLGCAFEILGFKKKGWSADVVRKFQESNNNYDVLYKVIDKYDAFEDGPWHDCDFRKLDTKYPNSKFILLERDNESWIKSVERHTNLKYQRAKDIYAKNDLKKSTTDFWSIGWKSPQSFREKMINLKNKKYENIKSYFSNRPDDLLVMQITSGWSELCPFLGVEIPKQKFPFENKTK